MMTRWVGVLFASISLKKNQSLKIIHALNRVRIQAVDMNGAEQ